MKKLSALLGIVVVGLMIVLVQGTVKDLRAEYLDEDRTTIQLESVFERDENVEKLLQYLVSVNQSNPQNEEDRSSNIYIHREGNLAIMDLVGIENNTYLEQVQKIERVLGLTGLTNFAYDDALIAQEKVLLAGKKENCGRVCHSKYYEQVIVTVSAYERDSYEGGNVKRDLRIEVPNGKLKDGKYSDLTEKVLEEGYYVSGSVQGEEKQILVLVNADSLADGGMYNYKEDEAGEMKQVDLINIRYEIITDKAKPEAVKVILSSKGKVVMDEKDKAVLNNIIKVLGLNEEESKEVNQLTSETLEKATKKQNKQVGMWQYNSKYTKSRDGGINYLEISLEP